MSGAVRAEASLQIAETGQLVMVAMILFNSLLFSVSCCGIFRGVVFISKRQQLCAYALFRLW